MGRKPQKIDVERALSENAAPSSTGTAEDDIQIVEVSGGETSAAALEPTLEPPAEPAAAAEAAAPAAAVSAELEAALERLRRMQAEHENYRKRVERDRGEHREQANAELVHALLPALDSFERALAGGGAAAGEFGAGVALIQRQLAEALVRAGLEPMEDLGAAFDPERHEAVSTTVEPGAAPGTILQVFERGYRFRGRLLRPARVRVAAAPAEGTERG